MAKTKRCAIYSRCSTMEQSNEPQILALRQLAEARGWTVTKIYQDHGISGTKTKRPGLDAMWADCRRHKFDTCLVFALDRLARSLKQLIEALDEFGRLGIDFVCLKQDIDSTSAAGRLLFNVVGAVAEFERGLIRERTIAGMEVARRRGRHIGRPPLREFSHDEKLKIREARSNQQTSIRQLAIQFGTTQWMVKRIVEGPCSGAN